MAFFQVSSTNPEFSFAISKNPTSEMLIKRIRQGNAFGWFNIGNSQAYNIIFRDASNEVSFKDYAEQEYEYLNISRYNSSLFLCSALTEFFDSALKKDSEFDKEGFEYTINIGMMHFANVNFIKKILTHFKNEYTIDATQIVGKNYSVTITTTKGIRKLLNFTILFSFFNAILSGEHLFIDDVLLEKYIKILNYLDAPYFVRYMVKCKLIKSQKQFERFKEALTASKLYKIEMTHGDTHTQRIRFIKDYIFNEGNNVLDIGCGEGRYVTAIAGKLKDEGKIYIAFDTDEDAIGKTQFKINSRELTNAMLFNNIEQLFVAIKTELRNGRNFDVIITEVIEHMTQEEAENLIKQFLSFPNVNSLIITTPNKDFNKYYYEEDKPRRDDHIFEMPQEEFHQFLEKHFGYCDIAEHYIGDLVDGIAPTLCAILKKK